MLSKRLIPFAQVPTIDSEYCDLERFDANTAQAAVGMAGSVLDERRRFAGRSLVQTEGIAA